MKTINKMMTICLICTVMLMSGCLETTTTDGTGVRIHNILTQETITHVNTFENGVHITGIMRESANGIMCYDLYAKRDEYDVDGWHTTGYMTCEGCGNDVEWYKCLVATKKGYKTLYLTGYENAEWRT